MTQIALSPSLSSAGRKVRRRIDAIEQGWPSATSLQKGGKDAPLTIYDCYPYLFAELFPDIDADRLEDFAVACRLLASAITLEDRLADGSLSRRRQPVMLFRGRAMRFEAVGLLRRLFPEDSAFWPRYLAYDSELINSSLEEARFAWGERPWSEYSEDLAKRLMIGKNAPARIVPAGLSELAGDETRLPALIRAVDHFNFAVQVFDDLEDIKDDLREGVPTLMSRRVLPNGPPAGLQGQEREEWLERQARRIYYEGHAARVLGQGIDSLDAALAELKDGPGLQWQEMVETMKAHYSALLQDIQRIIDSNIRQSRLRPSLEVEYPSSDNRWDHLAHLALRYIIDHWKRGLGEIVHHFELSSLEHMGEDSAIQSGDVFQRAILCDALCDADQLLGGQLADAVDFERRYLVSRRRRDGVGGWAYFPDWRFMPPDADTLGQILQVLLRSGARRRIEELCGEPLRVLFEENMNEQGLFDTWIIPADGRSPLQEKQAQLARGDYWAGADPEVMANILYPLFLYDPQKYGWAIEKGAAYMESRQKEDGSWDSKWYDDHYYAAYVIMRFLNVAAPASASLAASADFLRRSQRDDGGWSTRERGESDALSTALALLGLSLAPQHSRTREDARRAWRAWGFLESQVCGRGRWPACPFLVTVRPLESGERLVDIYQSKLITTAYVMKAALAWRSLAQQQPEQATEAGQTAAAAG
ncbi:MAG TPA: prenyltransferase/squalene oxidase repeat-containing protein [Acidobacteriota bacterium]|nr:prenyltransferase/squalene oxidase repeat-containing protein [Acidobacteriota bacterium]